MSNVIYMWCFNKRLPTKGHSSNTLDLFFDIKEPLILVPGYVYELPLGIKTFSLKENAKQSDLLLFPRSSCSNLPHNVFNSGVVGIPIVDTSGEDRFINAWHSNSIRLANTFGYIDNDYRGEWMARVQVDSPHELIPDRPYLQTRPFDTETTIEVITNLSSLPMEYAVSTTRGDGGYGSTS